MQPKIGVTSCDQAFLLTKQKLEIFLVGNLISLHWLLSHIDLGHLGLGERKIIMCGAL